MANILIGYDNLIDEALVSDGSWIAALPLGNIQDRELGLVARSNGLALGATKFVVDLQVFNVVRVIDIVRHTLSRDARFRIRSSTVSDFSVVGVDSGWQDVWPRVYPFGSLPWGAPNWWDGRYTDKEIGRQKTELIYILPEESTDQFWLFEFDDQANSAGFIDIGRVFIGPAWQPAMNASFGWSLGVEDASEIEVTLSGAESADERSRRRVLNFSTDWMEEDEALARAFEIQRGSGTTREIVVVQNPDDTVHLARRAFLARLGKLDPIVNPYVQLNRTSWQARELL
jgi:hypothetical protein